MLHGIGRSQWWSKTHPSLLNFKFLNQLNKKMFMMMMHSSSLESDLDATIPYLGLNRLGPSSRDSSSSSSSKSPIRKTKLFFYVYKRHSLAIMKPKNFHEALKHDEWMSPMKGRDKND